MESETMEKEKDQWKLIRIREESADELKALIKDLEENSFGTYSFSSAVQFLLKFACTFKKDGRYTDLIKNQRPLVEGN